MDRVAQKQQRKNQRVLKSAARVVAKSKKNTIIPQIIKPRPYKHSSIHQPTWQNPAIEYWEFLSRRRRSARAKTPRRVRTERFILVMLALYSISVGLWENFRQLWMQQNNFTLTGISNMISIGMAVSIVGVLLAGRFVKMPQTKNFVTCVLIVSSLNLLALHLLNNTGQMALIGICITLDVVTSALVFSSVYPLLTTVMKSNRSYSRRKLVEYLFRDLGILVGGFIIGRAVGRYTVSFNTCLLVAATFSAAAAVVAYRMDLVITERAPVQRFSVLKYILKNRIQRIYMLYAFLAGSGYYTIIGLKMLILTENFGFSASMGTNYLLMTGLAADLLGILALRYFTPKNDYVTLSIKFGTRLLIFAGAFLSSDLFLCFLALTWTILSSTAYENITDGYYINSVDNRYQLKYNTIKHVMTSIGEATGMFFCGQMLQLGIKYIFGFSAIILVAQLGVAFHLITLRRKQKNK